MPRDAIEKEAVMYNSDMKNMGRRLHGLRVEHGMDTFDVAEALSLSVESIQHYEYGDKTPKIWTIVSYSELFGVSTDYILKGRP